MRTALAFGWDGVFLLPGCADPFGDKAVRASRGAVLRLPIGRGDLADLRAAAGAHGLSLLAAEPEPPQPTSSEMGGSPSEERGSRGVCLVMGSEGQGLSKEVLAVCTPVAIPMVASAGAVGGVLTGGDQQGVEGRGAQGGGAMESLNVGVAGGILMFMLSEGLPHLLGRLAGLGQQIEIDRRGT